MGNKGDLPVGLDGGDEGVEVLFTNCLWKRIAVLVDELVEQVWVVFLAEGNEVGNYGLKLFGR